MKVIAIKQGFYGDVLRNPGDEFEVADSAKASWFTPADKVEAKAVKPKAKKDEPKALSEIAGADRKSFNAVNASADGLA